jgi:hypothetical protein
MPDALPHLNQVLVHLRVARLRPWSIIERCRQTFNALNAAQTGFARLAPTGRRLGEEESFVRLLTEGIEPRRRDLVLASAAIRALATMDPALMDHKVLKESGEWWYGQDRSNVSRATISEATVRQQNLLRALVDSPRGPDAPDPVRHLAKYLYVVRSNIAHGEKTEYAPSLREAQRDLQVCELVHPVLELVIEAMFDQPQRRLATYGTLRPGQIRHNLLSELEGGWEGAAVHGRVWLFADLPTFDWLPHEPTVGVDLLQSDQLPDAWPGLDAFEGPNYLRILVPAVRENGALTVANLYERFEEIV